MSNGLLDGGGESPRQTVVYSYGARTKSNFAPPESEGSIVMTATNAEPQRWIVVVMASYTDQGQLFEVRKVDLATNHIEDYQSAVWETTLGILGGMRVDFDEDELKFSVTFVIPEEELVV